MKSDVLNSRINHNLFTLTMRAIPATAEIPCTINGTAPGHEDFGASLLARRDAAPARPGLSVVGDDGNGVIDAGDISRAPAMSRSALGAAIAARPEPVVVIGDYHTGSAGSHPIDAAVLAARARGQTVTVGLEIPSHPTFVALVEARNSGALTAAEFRERFRVAAEAVYGRDDPRPALFADRIDRVASAGARVALLDPPPGTRGVADPVMERRALEAWRRHGTDRLFIEAGNLHARSRPSADRTLERLGIDAAAPLGRRLETALGAGAVLTLATVPAGALGPAAFRPAVGTWDAVVKIAPEAAATPRP